MEYDALFRQYITAPLQSVLGRTLAEVYYFSLWGEFNTEEPNGSGGCQGVLLVFDGAEIAEIEVDWDWMRPLLAENRGFAYHITVSDHSRRREAVGKRSCDDVGGLDCVAASEAQIWKPLIGEPLREIEILGERFAPAHCSPQAIRLCFPSASVIIAVGIVEDGIQVAETIGDGDEILIFPEDAWAALSDINFPMGRFVCCCRMRGETLARK